MRSAWTPTCPTTHQTCPTTTIGDTAPDGASGFADLIDSADDAFTIGPTSPKDPALLHFTSGTTGTPKGAVHAHETVVVLAATARSVLDLRPDDVYWCTADPGWVTATSYGMIAPLTIGATVLIDERDFDAERWLRVARDHEVTVWYTSPTAIRMMMRLGMSTVQSVRNERLRLVASVGEPLDPTAVTWGEKALGLPIRDTWWQTETGAIMIANTPTMDIRAGSMGRPVPGIEAAIVRHHDDGVEELGVAGVAGEIALRAGWPAMFSAYLGDEESYRRAFAGPWYLTGDMAKKDEDGYYWFLGRIDDVITSSGHLIGPTEVESAVLDHPAVSEAGAIGIPDAVAGELVKVYVTLQPDHRPSDDLGREIVAHARRRLGPAIAPKAVEFREDLPKTTSGKIARRVLKARELGTDVGDQSTLRDTET